MRRFVYYNAASAGASLLLDLYPGAVMAWSLRKLRTAYSGYCIRVRRSSDNAEQDIGFVNNFLDTATLLSFVGAGDGLVTTWYGQDAVGINFTQATAGRQPRIVSSGVLVTDGGKAAVNFYVSNVIANSNLNTAIIPIGSRVTANSSFYGVSKYTSATERRLFISDFGNTFFSLFPDTAQDTSLSSSPALSQAYINGALATIGQRVQLRTAISNSRFLVAVNNYALLNGTANRVELGREGAPIGALDFYQELVIYPTDQSANRTAIESNINTYYAIY
jgi:hypothetical protein